MYNNSAEKWQPMRYVTEADISYISYIMVLASIFYFRCEKRVQTILLLKNFHFIKFHVYLGVYHYAMILLYNICIQ